MPAIDPRNSPVTVLLSSALLASLLTGVITAADPDPECCGQATAAPTASLVSAPAAELKPEAAPGDTEVPEAPAEVEYVSESTSTQVMRVAYTTGDGGDPAQNWGDLHLPAGRFTTSSVPLAVLVHGGSWKDGLSAASMNNIAADLVERGMAVYNIEYRRLGTGGGWPTTFTDVADALEYSAELAREHPQLNLNEVVVVGYSAGAQLGTWAATYTPRDREDRKLIRPRKVVSVAGPLDLRYSTNVGSQTIPVALGGTPREVSDHYQLVSPIENLNPDIEVTAFHGTEDTHVPAENSQRYIARHRQLGGAGELVLAHGEDHVSLLRKGSPWYTRILDTITAPPATSEAGTRAVAHHRAPAGP